MVAFRGRISVNNRAITVLALWFLTLLFLANGGTSPDITAEKLPENFVYISQNEKQLEMDIAGYIERTHGVKAELGVFDNNKDDIYLRYVLENEKAPELNLTIDTRVTARDESGVKVTERSVRFFASFVLRDKAKTAEVRRVLLEMNNRWMAEKWMPGRIYLDREGDVAMETIINIPGKDIPLHGEMCFDTIARMSTAWSKYYRRLKANKIPLK